MTRNGDTPVLDTLAEMTAVSVDRCALSPRELMLVRIAALAGMDAPPLSYLLNAGTASEIGITLDDVQAVLVGIAPVIGAPHTVTAAGNILRALGFAVAVAEDDLAEKIG